MGDWLPAPSESRLRIIMLGYIVRGPIGGMTWANLHYLRGLAGLGHEVYFFEDSDDYVSCYDPDKGCMGTDPSYGLRYGRAVLERVGFGQHWVYYDAHRDEWHGPCASRVNQICGSADLLINRAGVNPLRPWLLSVPRRVLIDVDPVFTQIRHLSDTDAMGLAQQHNVFFSLAENIGTTVSRIPDDGLPWQPTRHPIYLPDWPVRPPVTDARWSTLMQWESYPAKAWDGITYGVKSDSFKNFLDLPRRVGQSVELVISGASAPRDLLSQYGWLCRDPRELSGDPWVYRSFIQSSKAELGIAKEGYCLAASGWFSERSAAYLASGRPVVTQDAAFSPRFPTDAGLLSFTDVEEAAEAVADVNARYAYHCEAAREIAEAYFDSGPLLENLVDRAMSSSLGPRPR